MLDIIHSVWFVWECARLSLTIAACTVFRTPLSLDAWLRRLDSEAICQQARMIKTQERMIATPQKLIETLMRQLMLEGITSWNDESSRLVSVEGRFGIYSQSDKNYLPPTMRSEIKAQCTEARK